MMVRAGPLSVEPRAIGGSFGVRIKQIGTGLLPLAGGMIPVMPRIGASKVPPGLPGVASATPDTALGASVEIAADHFHA